MDNAILQFGPFHLRRLLPAVLVILLLSPAALTLCCQGLAQPVRGQFWWNLETQQVELMLPFVPIFLVSVAYSLVGFGLLWSFRLWREDRLARLRYNVRARR